MKIINACVGCEKESLLSAFGFKGSALTCLWQVSVKLETKENSATGTGVQSALWSDAKVFAKYGEEESNKLMLELTRYAVNLLKGTEFETPFELFDMLYPRVLKYAEAIIKIEKLRKTFVLNSLVAVDFAAWQLWFKENNKGSFDDICVFDSKHQSALANVPLITYGTELGEIEKMALSGTPLFKIKIGSDPDKDGNPEAMLKWDKQRIKDIHCVLKDIKTDYTENGKILYYLDANGRYDTKERLVDFLDFCDAEGILENIILLEEPFDEGNLIDVNDISVCFAADESIHGEEDVKKRFELGFKAITLKPVAKTLTLTIRMYNIAKKYNMKCFCADLTVNPIMVSWNQCVSARLDTLDNMKIGIVESNGKQNYKNWDKMLSVHPCCGAEFTKSDNGIYILNEEFYEKDAGVFTASEYYKKLSEKGEVTVL
ncbi:MAG: L-alanine-DL-glutamate epimerase [Clostridia bacterium]|nr:L-alanine-DL-glutamate epimerase [Clostridia bacterium]